MAVHTARIGDIVFGRAPDKLEALALGSCVATFIYDSEAKVGVCAHVLLPETNEFIIRKDADHKLGKYADSAIPAAISMLVTKGGKRDRFKAKLAGGAKMFNLSIQAKSPLDVGARNILAVTEQLKKNNIPIVEIDRTIDDSLTKVVFDDIGGTFKAVSYAIENGFKSIAFVGGNHKAHIGKDRLTGYLKALRKYKLKKNNNWIIEGGFNEVDGYNALKMFYEHNNLPELIFAATYPVALGVVSAAKELKLKIPRDIDIISFGDSNFNRFITPAISCVNQKTEKMGRIAVEKIIDAIGTALATAYKREYGKRGQIIRAKFDLSTGNVEFFQIKIVVDNTLVRAEDEEPENDDDARSRFNPEHHIMMEDAKRIKKDAELDSEITFPLETKDDFGRIAAQTAKQVIVQKIREAEKVSILQEYGEREGEIVTGTVQRVERGNMFIDLGRATGILPYDEQIPSERYRQGERLRAYLYSVEESHHGTFLRLSRAHPDFLKKLFEMEVPELASGSVEIKEIAREAGSRSKLAVVSHDEHIDPVGSLVGQRGVRVATVMGELGGEKIDIIEWSEDPQEFIEEALSPAKVLNVKINKEEELATVEVLEDQQSLAIGKGGQNVRLAAKLTGWKIGRAHV